MKLTQLLFERTNAQNIDVQKSSNTQSNFSFQNVLNQTETEQIDKRQTQPTKENVAKKSRDIHEVRRTDNKFVSSERVTRDHTQQKADQTSANDQNTSVSNEQTNKKNDVDKTANEPTATQEKDAMDTNDELLSLENANAALAKELAQTLGISVEMLTQILASLNMQPLELTKPENLTLFMQKLFGAKSPQELLSVPNVQTAFKEATKVLEGFVETAKLLESTMQTQKTVQLQDVLPEATKQEATPEQMLKPQQATQTEETTTNEQAKTADETNNHVAPMTTQQTQNSTNQQNTGTQGDTQQKAFEPTTTNNQMVGMNVPNVTQQEAIFNKAEAIAPINTKDVIEQIVQKLKVEVKGDMTEVKITLSPEHLGDVSLKITTQNGIVSAQFLAENQRIKEVIEANFNQLRDALQEQGVMISSLEVSVGQEKGEQNAFFEQEQSRSFRNSGNMNSLDDVQIGEALQTVQKNPYGDELAPQQIDYEA